MSLKQRWSIGQGTVGAWSTLDDPVVVELMGRAGFDFVTIDLQHGFAHAGSLPRLIRALEQTPAHAVVRVPWNTPDQIMRAFDLGAEAVIVPLVNTAVEAAAAASASKYAPMGTRSWGPLWATPSHSPIEPPEGDQKATCVVMIETAAGLANIAEIAAVPGVDAVYVGPNDLALSLGLGRVGLRDSPELRDAILTIIDRAGAAGTVVGVDCAAEDAGYWRAQGAAFTISASDGLMFRAVAGETASAIRN